METSLHFPLGPHMEVIHMLVLSRKKNEKIVLGDDIEICIVDIRGDKVRLGISAPQKIPVHRKEVYEAIKRENALASGQLVQQAPTPAA